MVANLLVLSITTHISGQLTIMVELIRGGRSRDYYLHQIKLRLSKMHALNRGRPIHIYMGSRDFILDSQGSSEVLPRTQLQALLTLLHLIQISS